MLNALIAHGFEVAIPFGSGHPYDLVMETGEGSLLRVQCKRSWPVGGCLVFNCRSTDHGRGPRSYRGLADVFGVYFPPAESVFLVPLDAVAESEGRLRLDRPRNNQRRGIRFAADYAIDRWTPAALHELVAPAAAHRRLRLVDEAMLLAAA